MKQLLFLLYALSCITLSPMEKDDCFTNDQDSTVTYNSQNGSWLLEWNEKGNHKTEVLDAHLTGKIPFLKNIEESQEIFDKDTENDSDPSIRAFFLEGIDGKDILDFLNFLKKGIHPPKQLTTLYRIADYLLATDTAELLSQQILQTIITSHPGALRGAYFKKIQAIPFQRIANQIINQTSALQSYSHLPPNLKTELAEKLLARIPIKTISSKRATFIHFDKNNHVLISHQNGFEIQKRSAKNCTLTDQNSSLLRKRIIKSNKHSFTFVNWQGKNITIYSKKKGSLNPQLMQKLHMPRIIGNIFSTPGASHIAAVPLHDRKKMYAIKIGENHMDRNNITEINFTNNINSIAIHPFFPLFIIKNDNGLIIKNLDHKKMMGIQSNNIQSIAFSPHLPAFYVLHNNGQIGHYQVRENKTHIIKNEQYDNHEFSRSDHIAYHQNRGWIAISGLGLKGEPIVKIRKNTSDNTNKTVLPLAACATALAFDPEAPILWVANRKNIEVFNLSPRIQCTDEELLSKIYLKYYVEQTFQSKKRAYLKDHEAVTHYNHLSKWLKKGTITK